MIKNKRSQKKRGKKKGKILDSMNFYIKKIGIEIPDLVFLLNKIISTQFKKIEDNKEFLFMDKRNNRIAEYVKDRGI